MRQIWKFELGNTHITKIRMPLNAKILCVQAQMETPCIWAEVKNPVMKNPIMDDLNTEERVFITYGTGLPMNEERNEKYIGTYQLMSGNYIFHVYEIVEE